MSRQPWKLASVFLATVLLAACGNSVSGPPPESPGPGQAAPSASATLASSGSPAALLEPAGAPSSSPKDAAVPSAPVSAPATQATSPSSAPAASSAVIAPPTANRQALPVRLLIPSIKVTAAVEQVGVTPDGAMDAPKEWNDVGWFDLGYRPGEAGSAVMAGHLDSTTDKAILFWDLNKLKAGDKVLVDEQGGAELTFSVQSAETYAFDNAPLQRIFGIAPAPMLNLVTCNGVFDRGSRNYDKRLVVYTKQLTP